jgi:hypothetical protein
VNNRLIGHRFWGNLGSLLDFGKAITNGRDQVYYLPCLLEREREREEKVGGCSETLHWGGVLKTISSI